MALALEGTPVHNNATSGSSLTTGAFTTSTGSEVFLAITTNFSSANSVSSITGGSLTFARRTQGGSATQPIELWAAKSTGALSGVQFTVNYSAAVQFTTVDVFAFSGQDTTTIWDGNAAVPANGNADPISISTSNANDAIITAFRLSTQNPTQGTGFTKISGADFQLAEYQIVSSTQSGLSCAVGTGAGTANGSVADALMAAAGGGTQSYSYAASGGLTFAGAATQSRASAPAVAGGLVFAGAADYSNHSAGTQSYSYTAAGGLTFAGASDQARVSARAAAGGLSFGGASPQARATVRDTAGGLNLGGDAVVSTHEAARTVTAAGGLQFGGSAAVTYAGGIVASSDDGIFPGRTVTKLQNVGQNRVTRTS